MSYTSGSHTVFHHRYHIVWITKYRYKVLEGALRVSGHREATPRVGPGARRKDRRSRSPPEARSPRRSIRAATHRSAASCGPAQADRTAQPRSDATAIVTVGHILTGQASGFSRRRLSNARSSQLAGRRESAAFTPANARSNRLTGRPANISFRRLNARSRKLGGHSDSAASRQSNICCSQAAGRPESVALRRLTTCSMR
jgi:hypothetical protein